LPDKTKKALFGKPNRAFLFYNINYNGN